MTGFRIGLIFILLILYLFLFGFIDYQLITPLLPLPDDICYYHENTPPTWIKLLYLDSSGHTEPPFSGLHMLLILLTSLTFSILTEKKLNKWIKNRKNNSTQHAI
mgnify:CR=1 FL=1